MDIDRTEILATAGAPQNESPRIWMQSVSAGMRTVEAMIRELSQNDVPMLVVAEHGSGKAAVAARIHALSRRAPEPFQVYQGLEASEEILAARDGQSGTVYLQEVGDLTAAAQKELVRQIGSSSAVCPVTSAEPRASWNPRSGLASSAKTFIMESAEFVCDCLLYASGKRIFRFCATGFSRPLPVTFAGPYRCLVPKPKISFWNTTGREI